MFQITMSPKALNAEKLEKKFASLTKSRESILHLSTWIIRHKEFYKEIVDHWLDALSKDINSLPMFYVANDVIQNCGRKKAPEFREAFASVLERAVSLENVKEIKTEVIRMLTLWYERSIYDSAFYKKLTDKLNDIEESESEEELDEADIITNFKLENLADALEKMKTLEEELLIKEEFLEDVDEPAITDIDNLIVKMDSQKELRKVDKYQKLVESYIALADKVMAAQKEALLNLKYSNIFYTAQLEDAKKVAHAYRIYGKKVKIVEKTLMEKITSLPEASPVLEEKCPEIELDLNIKCQSPGLSVMPDVNNENSNQSSNLDLSISPKMNESDSFFNTNMLNEKYKSPLFESQNSSSSVTKDLSKENEGVQVPAVIHILNKEEEEGSFKVVDLPIIATDKKILKSPLLNTASKKGDKLLKSPVVVIDATNNQITTDTSKSEKILKKSIVAERNRRTSVDEKLKSPATDEVIKKASIDKVDKSVMPKVLEKTFDNDNNNSIDICESVNSCLEEKKIKNVTLDKESATKQICSVEKNEEISSTFNKQENSSDLQTLSDIENIDFLLEKSYNEQRTKSKASFKRKIDNLLKMKQSKTCKLSKDDNLQKIKVATDTYASEDSNIISSSNLDDGKKSNISESVTVKDETVNDENSEHKEIVASTSEKQIGNIKVDQSLDLIQKPKTVDSGSTSESVEVPSTALFSSFPDIPTELLKNILDKHRTNLNQSLNVDSCSISNDVTNLKSENVKLSDSFQDNINCTNNLNDNKDISSGVLSALESETYEVTSIIQDKSIKDCESSSDNNKCDPKVDTENVAKSSSTAKMTPLMENLQKLLKCFTEKGPAFEELKNSKALKTLPTYSVKSTLKLYHVLNEHHKNNNAFNSSNVNNNSSLDFPSETVSSSNNKSSLCNYSSTNAFTHSENDNLEIMDMEVDSDDDNTK